MTERKSPRRGTTKPPRASAPKPAPPAARFVATTVEVEGREETRIVEVPALDPVPWDADADLRIVGQRIPRADALEKVTGVARYTADIQRPGMLHAVVVRAAIPRGRVAELDTSAARAMPGVLDVLDADTINRRIRVRGVGLFSRDVSYAGQPIAAICAESEEIARRAAAAVRVVYERTPFVLTAADALRPDAPKVRSSGNLSRSSPAVSQRGDVVAALADAEVVIEREYRTPSALHTALEPHGTVAEWEGDRLTVWESTQGIFAIRADVAKGLGIPQGRVRVIKDYMGGGFGAKNEPGAHTFAAAILAQRLGRPVRCVNDREGEQLDSGHRPPTVQRVTLAARRDGRLTAIVLDADIALGAGGWDGGPAKIFRELYSCPNVRTTERFVYVDTQAMDSFRAPGHVEGSFALESAMDALAGELGMDPLALRLANFADRDQDKSRPYSSNRLRECYGEAAQRFGWGVPSGERQAARGERQVTSKTRRGVGLAAQVWGAGGGPPAYALVKLNADGSADVLSGTQDLGTGARTVFAQIAAESLGVGVGDVRVVLGDTERTPYTGNSWGSMTTASVGPAVRMAAEDARAQLLDAAAAVLGVAPATLAIADGTITATDGRTTTVAKVCATLGNVMIVGRGSRGPNPANTALATFGVQMAEVEVDVETGVVRVVRIVAVHDAGRIINPTLAESQLEGGIIQGIGFALFEERVLDARLGVPLNPTMHDYKIPTMADIPVIDATLLDGADTVANHTGARGLAEPPIIPTAGAIANAVRNAIGREIHALPLAPWRVLAALGDADA